MFISVTVQTNITTWHLFNDLITVQLAKEHAGKVQQLEKKQEQLLKERQSAYEEQFSSDIDFYKKHGKLERKGDLIFIGVVKLFVSNLFTRVMRNCSAQFIEPFSEQQILDSSKLIEFADNNFIFVENVR